MKKATFSVFLLLLLGASFFAGYLFHAGNLPRNTAESVPLKTVGDLGRPGAAGDDSEPAAPGSVRVPFYKRQLLGVRIETVERNSQKQVMRLLGRVTGDENRTYRINAAVDGWIQKINHQTTGSLVKKDDVLALFYSPEFLSAQQAYLYSLSSLDRFKASGREGPRQIQLTEVNMQQYRDTLMNLGMSALQIREIAETRQYTENVQIRSPAEGFIALRNVSPGLRIEKGSELYRIVDLRRVWILVDLYEKDIGRIRPGGTARVMLRQQQKVYQAKVSEVLPQFDAASRTLKLRLEADNPGYCLRPDMFVDVEFSLLLPKMVNIPAEAVLHAGLRKTVFVDRGNGLFEPREVETGRQFGSRVEIMKGLREGERIVSSGNFLIDAESKTDLAGSQSRAD